MQLQFFLLSLLCGLAEALGRFREEENAFFNNGFRPEPLARLPGMVSRNHPIGPPGFSPPIEMIRAMRREQTTVHHRGQSHRFGDSRRKQAARTRS